MLLLVLFLFLEQRVDIDVLDALQRLDRLHRWIAAIDLVQAPLAIGVAVEHIRIVDALEQALGIDRARTQRDEVTKVGAK